MWEGEHRLTAFENKVLRRIFGPNREAATGGWRKPNYRTQRAS
jgi:hypothetical protein